MLKDKIVGVLLSVCFIFFTFAFVIDTICFNSAFYEYEYTKNKVAETIDIGDDELKTATDVLLGYITGDVEDLDVEVTIDSKQTQMFNAKEKAHMVDVKDLYDKLRIVKWSTLLIFLSLSGYYLFKGKKLFALIKAAYVKVLALVGGLVGALAVFALCDFNLFWNTFHKLIFTNDLWLLDPLTDRLINMVPGPFFYDLVLLIIIVYIVIIIVFYMIVRYLSKLEDKR